MSDNHNYCVIIAGGWGTRFWPVSRVARPKQFLDILGMGKTFLRMTFNRYAQIVPVENILVVTSEQYHELVKSQLPQILDENILLEPSKRNTAPCVAYATYKLLKKNQDATVIVAPSDHNLSGMDNFRDTMACALEYASSNDALLTIGVQPTHPDTNYGYIQANKKSLETVGSHIVYGVKTFTEKPDEALAKGVEWKARYILSAPCCQHELQKTLADDRGAFAGLMRQSILRERLCDILTDSFRAMILRILGFKVQVIEFVSSEATARNIMLKCEYGVKPGQPGPIGEYLSLRDYWKVTPWLETRLEKLLGKYLERYV